jgi:hypothetical protein
MLSKLFEGFLYLKKIRNIFFFKKIKMRIILSVHPLMSQKFPHELRAHLPLIFLRGDNQAKFFSPSFHPIRSHAFYCGGLSRANL